MRNSWFLRIGILLAVTLPVQVVSQTIPRMQLTTLDRTQHRLKEYLSEGPVLINFWSLSCAPCKKEMQHLNRLTEQYQDAGFTVISINTDTPRSLSRVRAFIRSHGYQFPVFIDPDHVLFARLAGRVLPYSIFVRKDGGIEARHTGYAPGDERKYESIINNLIQ